MGYQRAQWHSGLTYQQACEYCGEIFQYNDYALDYRPWYADGYIDCPKCKNHLRHNEKYALNGPGMPPQTIGIQESQLQPNPAPAQAAPASDNAKPTFCTSCGNKRGPNDRFCAYCGAKLL